MTKGMIIWAQGEDERKHYTVCGYFWPSGKTDVLELKFFVQHVIATDQYDAKSVGVSQAKALAGVSNDSPAVAFAVFAGHLHELSWTTLTGQNAA